MDWGFIFSNTAAWLIAPETIAYAHRHRRPRRALRLRRPAQLRPGRLHGARRLRLRDLDPHLPPAVVGRASSSAWRAAVVFAFVLGLPTLRLRADYLAIVTIAAAEVVRLLFNSTVFDDVTGLGGRPRRLPRGLPRGEPDPAGHLRVRPVPVQRTRTGGCASSASSLLVIVACSWSGCSCAARGVACVKGIREDEDAVRALGKNVFSVQDAGADPRRRASARSAASCCRCRPRWCPASTCRR